MAGIDDTSGCDNRGAVLVIMKDRNVQLFAKTAFDDEAFRAGDIFQIDAAPGRADILDRIDDLLGVLGEHLDIDRVDVGKALEEDRLAFHDGLRCHRAKVAKAEDRGPVGDNGNHIAL